MISGGMVPGGMRRRMVWLTDVTCAKALVTLVPGWNATRTMATPFNVSERNSRMLSTLFMMASSLNEVTLLAISGALRP